MRMFALILAAGVSGMLSFAAAAKDISPLLPDGVSGAAIVTQYQSSGAIRYSAEMKFSLTQIVLAKLKISDFEEYLRGEDCGFLPIDQKKQTMQDADGNSIEFDYSVDFSVESSLDSISMTITFNNFYSWVRFHGLALGRASDDKGLFFVERTTNFNTHQRFFDETGTSGKTAVIVDKFFASFSPEPGAKIGYLYILTNSYRHTKTNADKVENDYGDYTYFFKVSEDLKSEVEIFDRFANTPIWYGLAVAATAVAMTVFYLVVKSKRPKLPSPAGE